MGSLPHARMEQPQHDAESKPETAAPAGAEAPSTFSIHHEPPLPFASRRQDRFAPRRRSGSRRQRRFVRKWRVRLLSAVVAAWLLVSFLAALAEGIRQPVVERGDALFTAAFCYSASDAAHAR